jgi:hypothetical protein
VRLHVHRVHQQASGGSAIARGAARILDPMSKGAEVQVLNLHIHPSDFKLHRFEQLTAMELEKLLIQDEA